MGKRDKESKLDSFVLKTLNKKKIGIKKQLFVALKNLGPLLCQKFRPRCHRWHWIRNDTGTYAMTCPTLNRIRTSGERESERSTVAKSQNAMHISPCDINQFLPARHNLPQG